MPETISLAAADGRPLDVAVVRPTGDPVGGLVVIHEIWGLSAHILDVAERFAAEGYLVVAPDILSHGGVAPALGSELFALMNDPDEAVRVAAQPRLRDALTAVRSSEYAEWAVGALQRVVDWLGDQPGVDGRLGAVGFCFGGTYTFLLAAADDRIRAAVPFYGSAPAPDRMHDIQAPVLALYGAHDPTLIDALPSVREDMAEAGVDFEAVVYPDAGHAFFNDTGSRFRPDEAADAWRRTLAFLSARLA
ncbi:MAG: dienelactone hydrolase family protein [Microbacterium sp.]|uniref:dienelactone hydrolase family protein n=1 Tax=Microbacterium sp. TaxID=51671 RepID=UPI001ACEA429|nr:dienelactone hydrolase family protein [Microbacterium sp.]MBN9154472.1 dienelactone hydrolase family protein [Microbacterium sp.]